MNSIPQFVSILYVEDDDIDVRIASRALQKGWKPIGPYEDYRLHQTNTLGDAVEECQILHPHVVLLDLNLPDSCGLETAEKFMKTFPLAKVIAMTGTHEFGLIPQLMSNGISAILSKNDLEPMSINLAIRCALAEEDLLQECDPMLND